MVGSQLPMPIAHSQFQKKVLPHFCPAVKALFPAQKNFCIGILLI